MPEQTAQNALDRYNILHPPYVAYAQAISAWASFERSVDIKVWIAVGANPQIGACVTNQIQSVRAKLLIIESIVDLLDGSASDPKLLRRFRNSIESITRQRNRLVHDPHRPAHGAMHAYRASAQNENGFIVELLPIDKLHEFSAEMMKKSDEFYHLSNTILQNVGLGPSPDKYP